MTWRPSLFASPFPRECSGPNLVGEGAVIECRGEDFVVHERHEIGVMRYSDIRGRMASTLEEAVGIYLSAVAPNASIDGVLVDWDA
ncbi:MAG: hypothetical protein IPK13_28160 [Deltaproteobacteria bacterium]|nr:hypothetical protein [Deltaproteobacteria bacterium]